ncbi:coagulation factor X-like isoform X2 [Lissotriton helveticus]
MAGPFCFLALVTFSAVLLQAEENVFIKKQHATEILLRRKRANSGLEEFLKGNIERECMEERCSYEEAREVFENDDATRKFWNKYQDGDQCESVHCNYRGACVDGIGEYTCLCVEGYEGKNCETVTFPCGKRHAISQKRSDSPDEPSMINSKNDSRVQVDDIDSTDAQTRIVGGRDCSPGECPWQALLVNENQEGFCGGTILNEYFILTSAHCVNQSRYFEVVVGEVDTKKKEGTESVHMVERIFIHPIFVLQTYDYDIALLRLKEPMNFTQYVIPVCIPEMDFANDVLMAQEAATVSGFGIIQPMGQMALKLQVLQVPYIGRQQCIKSSNFAITRNMFCAGYDTAVKDACQGDLGGPHVTPFRGTFFITGIVSWGEGCAQEGNYGVYTKVSNFHKWISATMKIKS